jgi:hypothetical protein
MFVDFANESRPENRFSNANRSNDVPIELSQFSRGYP